jgi:fermentation-respiration switch protein FrsA (DUF1100 family)
MALKDMIISILFSGLIIYGAILVYFYLVQSSFIYFPYKDIAVTPMQAGMLYKEVTFSSKDGNRLNGWFIPADDPKGVLLFCHGNAGNISDRMESIRIFHEIGLSVFIFDYRGYGKSEGVPGESGTYLDAEAAWEYLITQEHYDASQITVFGRSIGGAIAAKLAAEKSPGALIVESSFTSIVDMGAQIYPFLPVRLLSRFRYDTRKYIKEVRSPVLVIHSSDDEIIPFSHGEAIFEAANAPKEFLKIQGSHNEGFLLSGSEYSKAIEKFIVN